MYRQNNKIHILIKNKPQISALNHKCYKTTFEVGDMNACTVSDKSLQFFCEIFKHAVLTSHLKLFLN